MAEESNKPLNDKVEKLRAMQFLGSIHKLTPRSDDDSKADNVAIVEALKSTSIIEENIFELRGLVFDPSTKKCVQYRDPVMNEKGIANYRNIISTIARNIEFSSFHENDIKMIARYFFRINYPYFTIYRDEFALDRSNFNLIANSLMAFIFASLNKAKGAGHRNVVRGTYSEDLLGRYAKGEELKSGRESFLSKFNPFRKK